MGSLIKLNRISEALMHGRFFEKFIKFIENLLGNLQKHVKSSSSSNQGIDKTQYQTKIGALVGFGDTLSSQNKQLRLLAKTLKACFWVCIRQKSFSSKNITAWLKIRVCFWFESKFKRLNHIELLGN